MALAGLVILMINLVPKENILGGLILLFAAGFLVYGPRSCFWPLSPDLLGVKRSGTGVGVMNSFASVFAGAGEPFIGYMVDLTSEQNIVFVVTAVMCFLSSMTILFVRR
jgi:OPA family glycerol-3-phosphate transporter-like MFS transporter